MREMAYAKARLFLSKERLRCAVKADKGEAETQSCFDGLAEAYHEVARLEEIERLEKEISGEGTE